MTFPIRLSRLGLAWVMVGIFAVPALLSALRLDPGQVVAAAMVWVFLPAAVMVVRHYRDRRPTRAPRRPGPGASAPPRRPHLDDRA